MLHPTPYPTQKSAPIARETRPAGIPARDTRSEYDAHQMMRAHLTDEPELLHTIDLNLSIDWGY